MTGLVDLWPATMKPLDRYHRLVQSQADSSYFMAQLAAGAGFAVLLGAAVVAGTARTGTASGVAGGLGAFGGAIAAYVARTFQRSYEQATTRLLSYFQQPLDLSRLLAAERLLVGLDGDARNQAVLAIINAAVRLPQPAPSPGSSVKKKAPRAGLPPA